MGDVLALAAQNLMAPAILFFVLGALAGFARSDLTIPEPIVKTLSLYLLLALAFKGGVAARATGFTVELAAAAIGGILLSFFMPWIAFWILRALKLDKLTAAATAAHYGSISIVTFAAASDFATRAEIPAAGFMVAVAALMETPAIISALLLAGGKDAGAEATSQEGAQTVRGWSPELIREVVLNGSVVVLVGSFVIGLLTGDAGMRKLDVFVNAFFQGALCLFLLDMGLVAARRLAHSRRLTAALFGFGVGMPLIGAALGLGAARAIGLDVGSAGVLATLAASASYIAAPSAMRIALPEADPGVYLTLSLGVTFPFNLTIGIPVYFGVAKALWGG